MKKFIFWLLFALALILIGLFIRAYIKEHPPVTPPPPKEKQVGALYFGISDRAYPISAAKYSTGNKQNTTNAAGEFEYHVGDNITFTIANLTFTLAAKEKITLADLSNQDINQQRNLALLLSNIDADNTLKNGITIDQQAANKINAIDLNQSENDFIAQLYLQLGHYPKLSFIPSLGINLESPQAKADTVGQAIPFVDIFRTARPFSELSPKGVKYDQHGWPISIPEKSFARTKLLQGTLQNAIPNGRYTVLYDGKGKLSFGADSLETITQVDSGTVYLQIKTKDASRYTEANSLSVVINQTDPDDPIRNIRILMPGGICRDINKSIDAPIEPNQSQDNPFLRVTKSEQCPSNSQFVSFAQLYKQTRNSIVFNPDYLQHLRNFRVIRMMNFMEASPSYLCRNLKAKAYKTCLNQSISWQDRATMQDAVWGGSSRTPFTQHKGVPIEVLVELANQLNRDPWFTLPHYIDDESVKQFAHYIHQHLNKTLKPHIEYSNETWNPGFQSHYYVKQKGIEAGLNSVPTQYSFRSTRNADYFASLRYYVQRSLEIFDIWNTEFSNDSSRLVKIISGQQGDTVLSEEMLQYENASQKVDALAIAPYFFGCIERSATHCTLSTNVLSDVESVDDIFDVIDHNSSRLGGDPSALEGTLEKIRKQAQITHDYKVKLMTYEGGQHLTIMGSMGKLEQKEKNKLRKLFRDANRDPRMKAHYTTLLNHWKALHNDYNSVSLFTLYTMAQSYYEYGSWGVKEWLTQSREDTPKFDAAMAFQENNINCWWQDCGDTISNPEKPAVSETP